MIICKDKQFIFIHIPKNSGTEMSNNLKKTYKCDLLNLVDRNTGIDKMHLYQDVISKYIDIKLLNTYMTFCIVRNPYEKIYSAWNFIKDRHKCKDINDFIKRKISKEFIYGLELIPKDARVHYRPQYTFVYDIDEHDDIVEKKVDEILKYENLNEDIMNFNKKFNMKIPQYGKKNKYKPLKYIKHFNQESIQKVNELYKKDFELFNYEML